MAISSRSAKRKVIYDQDNRGPLTVDTDGTLVMLQADTVDILGISTVTCDQWVKQETAYVLRLLELMDRTEIPVYMGAEYPLLNTKAEAQERYRMFGARRLEGFLGAFGEDGGEPDEVTPLPAPYNRFAKIKEQPGSAAEFFVRTVREHPHEVTFYCGGSLTNLALAIMLDPGIVPLTQEVVFMGGGIHHASSSINVYFDAEAAKMAFRAPWPKFTVVTTDLAEMVHLEDDHKVDDIVAHGHFPISDLFREYVQKPQRENPKRPSFRMSEGMMAAWIIDPTIFTDMADMYVDVVTDNNGHYGDTLWWDIDWRGKGLQRQNNPSAKAGRVNVLKNLDKERFRKFFVDILTGPINGSNRAGKQGA